ncbi:MAG: TolB family protein [Longimicrobiales bacterium]
MSLHFGMPRTTGGLASALVLAYAVGGCSEPDVPAPSQAPAAPPDTDIYLASLSGSGAGLALGPALNVTDRIGYDNQPAFMPDGGTILYTAADDAGRTDIMGYDIEAGQGALVTQTYPESEYSATPLPDGSGFSAIRVEADSTQRLWRFNWDGSDPSVLLPDIAPAGYHAWAGSETLILFVLGAPATLQVAQVGPGEGRILDEGIGRSLQQVPGGRGISYVRVQGDERTIRILDPVSGESEAFAPAVGAGQDHAWTPDGDLLMAEGGILRRWSVDGEMWTDVPMDGTFDGQISRLAVSPAGDQLAFVGAR